MILLDLLQNLALLVAMAAAYRVISREWTRDRPTHRFTAGLLFGGVALVGMMTPVRLMPGLIFDGRSIILGVAGFVGGPITAVVSGTIAAAYRVHLGGVGAGMGVAVIVESAALGVAFRAWRRRSRRDPGMVALWLFGLAIHLIMAALLLTLPGGIRQLAWTQLGLGIVLVYPLVTALACRVFLDYERAERDRREIEASEARHRTLLSSMGDGVVATDTDGRVTLLNPVAEALTGWSSSEAAGRPVEEVLRLAHEDTGEPLGNPVRPVLEGEGSGRLPATAVLVARDGSTRPVADSVTPVRGPGGEVTGAVVVFRDQTDERESRRSLRESRERMALALEGGDLGTWDWDVRSGGVVFNERWASMLGYTLDEIDPVVSTWSTMVHPDDLPSVMAALDEHLEGGTARYETEHRVRHKSGKWVWVLDRGLVIERGADGHPIRVAGTHLDITERREAEAALRESEERFRRLAENAPDVIYRYRLAPEPGFEYVSPAATAMTGFTPEDHYANPNLGFELVHPEDRHLLEAVSADGADPSAALTLRWVRRDGRVIWTEQRNVLVHDKDGAVVALEGIARDITERKELEAHLVESETNLALFIEHAPAALAMLDGEMRYLAHSRRWLQDYGLGEDLVGRSHYEVFPEIGEAWKTAHRRALAGEVVRSEQDRFVRADGSTQWLKWEVRPWHRGDGKVGGIVVMSEDITEGVASARSLRESEERFREALDHLPDLVLILDSDLRIRFANAAVASLWGTDPQDALGRRVEDLLPGPSAGPFVTALRSAASALEPRSAEGELRIPELPARYVRSYFLPLPHPDGSLREVVAITRDLTESRRAEAEIRALAEGLEVMVEERTRQLREANAELESFSYSVSHDLKAPLRAIDGYVSILEEDGGLSEPASQLLREVKDNARHMARLIDDLLALSGVGRASLKRERLELPSLVVELVARERETAPGRRIELDVQAPHPVHADPTLLRQALVNVLANAVKFTRPREVARIHVLTREDPGGVRVQVRDNGVGFDSTYVHKLFRTFERLHYRNEFEGTGVGLAIVKRIVERHGGSVSIQGEVDRGVTVDMVFPVPQVDGPDSPENEDARA